MITAGTGFTSTAADLADCGSSDTQWTPSKGLKSPRACVQRAAEGGVEEECVTTAITESETTQISKGNLKGVVVSSARVSIQNTFENQISVELGADADGLLILHCATP